MLFVQYQILRAFSKLKACVFGWSTNPPQRLKKRSLTGFVLISSTGFVSVVILWVIITHIGFIWSLESQEPIIVSNFGPLPPTPDPLSSQNHFKTLSFFGRSTNEPQKEKKWSHQKKREFVRTTYVVGEEIHSCFYLTVLWVPPPERRGGLLTANVL